MRERHIGSDRFDFLPSNSSPINSNSYPKGYFAHYL